MRACVRATGEKLRVNASAKSQQGAKGIGKKPNDFSCASLLFPCRKINHSPAGGAAERSLPFSSFFVQLLLSRLLGKSSLFFLPPSLHAVTTTTKTIRPSKEIHFQFGDLHFD